MTDKVEFIDFSLYSQCFKRKEFDADSEICGQCKRMDECFERWLRDISEL